MVAEIVLSLALVGVPVAHAASGSLAAAQEQPGDAVPSAGSNLSPVPLVSPTPTPGAIEPAPAAPPVMPAAPSAPVAPSTLVAPPLVLVGDAVPPSALTASTEGPGRHELALSLVAGGALATALALVGFAEVGQFDGYSHRIATASVPVSYSEASARLASARGFYVASIALSVVALACFGTAGGIW